MTARLDQIRFETEQARRDAEQHQRDFEADKLSRAEQARQERARFIIQMIVTSIAWLTAAVALILHLIGKV